MGPLDNPHQTFWGFRQRHSGPWGLLVLGCSGVDSVVQYLSTLPETNGKLAPKIWMVGRLSRFLLGGAELSVFGGVVLLKEMIPKSYRIPWIFTKTSNMSNQSTSVNH